MTLKGCGPNRGGQSVAIYRLPLRPDRWSRFHRNRSHSPWDWSCGRLVGRKRICVQQARPLLAALVLLQRSSSVGMLGKVMAEDWSARRRWGSFACFLLGALGAAISVRLTRSLVATFIGGGAAIPCGILTYRSRGLISSNQAVRIIKSKRFLVETVILAAIVNAGLALVPVRWFALVGLPAVGAVFGAGLKLLLVGTKIETEFPER